jgi:AcrR family transcriptional regulator
VAWSSPGGRAERGRERLRERILDHFAEGVRGDGPRGVVMAELARDLGISTRTLYQQFASKEELVGSLLARWADQLDREQRARIAGGRSPYEQMLEAAASWLEGQCRFSPTFWAQLTEDFPQVALAFQERLRRILREGRDVLLPFVREDLDRGLAMSFMNACLRAAADPARCERLGITREQAVREAIDVWVRGTLRPERALHAVPDPG